MNCQLAKHVCLCTVRINTNIFIWIKEIVSVNKSTEQAALEHTEEDKWWIQEVPTSLAAAKDISIIATVAIHDVASRPRGGRPGAVATCRYKNLIGQLDGRFTHHQVVYVKNVFYALVTCWIFKLKPSIFGERPCYCSLFSWNKSFASFLRSASCFLLLWRVALCPSLQLGNRESGDAMKTKQK